MRTSLVIANVLVTTGLVLSAPRSQGRSLCPPAETVKRDGARPAYHWRPRIKTPSLWSRVLGNFAGF